MAGKNEVTLTFAGDSRSLDKTFDKVNNGSDKVADNFRKVGKETEEYASHLDRAGEAGGNAESQFLGLGAGISGTTTLMKGGSLSAEEMAMGLADIGDAVEHTVVPWLGKGRDAIGGLIDQLGGAKSAAIATGAAIGAAGLVVALKAYNDAADEARGKDLAEEFEKTGDAAATFAEVGKGNAFAMGDMANAFDNLLAKSPVLAQSYLDQAEASGQLSEEMRTNAQQAIDDLATAEERLATSIRGTTDAMQARIDPFFAVISADHAHRDALQAVDEAERAATEAQKEHGRGSAEYAAALQALEDAQLATTETAYGQEVAIQQLAQSMLDTGATTQDIIGHFQGLANKGSISQQAVDELASSLRNVPGRVDTTITAHDFATTVINAVGDRARVVDGTIVDILMQASWVGGGSAYAAFTGRTRAGGGIVDYMASGGISRGPRGTDTVPTWLTPGEMVLNKAQQAQLWGMANGRGGYGGGGVTVIVQGSVFDGGRELERHMRDAIQRGGFGGLL